MRAPRAVRPEEPQRTEGNPMSSEIDRPPTLPEYLIEQDFLPQA